MALQGIDLNLILNESPLFKYIPGLIIIKSLFMNCYQVNSSNVLRMRKLMFCKDIDMVANLDTEISLENMLLSGIMEKSSSCLPRLHTTMRLIWSLSEETREAGGGRKGDKERRKDSNKIITMRGEKENCRLWSAVMQNGNFIRNLVQTLLNSG